MAGCFGAPLIYSFALSGPSQLPSLLNCMSLWSGCFCSEVGLCLHLFTSGVMAETPVVPCFSVVTLPLCKFALFLAAYLLTFLWLPLLCVSKAFRSHDFFHTGLRPFPWGPSGGPESPVNALNGHQAQCGIEGS